MSEAGMEGTQNKVTNGKSIASLILGILSIVSFLLSFISLILGIVGLILGIIGLKEVKRINQDGRRIALAGIICSCIGILITILLSIIGYIVWMNFDSVIP